MGKGVEMSRDTAITPLGLSRPQAAAFVGMGVSLFDRMVEEGRMPRPRKAYGRLIWHRQELEDAFAELPYHGNSVASFSDASNSFAAIRARGQGENTA